MATIDFPSNPVLGQQYKYNPGTPEEKAFIFKAGQSGTASDGYWMSSIAGGSFGPASATEINAGTEDVKYIAPDQLELSKYLDPAKLQVILDAESPIWRAGRKNLIINGDMRIWQRGTSFPSGSAQYTADRWVVESGITVSRQEDAPANEGFTWCLESDNTFRQGVELPQAGDPGIFSLGKMFTISVWAKFTGTIGLDAVWKDVAGSTTNQIVDTSALLVGTGSWQKYTHTFTVSTSPVSTTTTLTFGIGETATSIRVTGFQVEQVTSSYPAATAFEYRPIGEELALCQRYYEKWTGNFQLGYYALSTTGAVRTHLEGFKVDKRVVPIVSLTVDSLYGTCTSIIVSSVSYNGWVPRFNTNSTSGHGGGSFREMTADAEL